MTKDKLVRRRSWKEGRALRVPPGAVCAIERCRATDRLLVRDSEVRCYTHIDGPAPRYEKDHLAGRENLSSYVAGVRASDHRERTEAHELLADGIPPARGNPLLLAAHVAISIATQLWLLARWFRDLSAWLDSRHGRDWHDGGPPFPFGP